METRKRTRRHARTAIGATTSASLASPTDAMHQALQAGVLAFLPLQDMPSVLNTCRSLRFDGELPLLGLAHSAVGAHLRLHCASDWMSVRPSFLTVPGLLQETICEDHTTSGGRDAWDDVQRFVQAFDASLDARRGQHAALLSALAMVERRVVPLCYTEHEINRYGDISTARPVFLPLPLGLQQRDAGYEFTTQDVKKALNVCFDGIGDVFVATPQEYNHVSDFGAHWEAIEVSVATGSRGGPNRKSKSKCALCDTAKHTIKEYRKDAKAALKRFNEVLKIKRDEWKAEGCDLDEIHQRRSELKAEFFPEDSYPDINFADGQDDAILADICESGKFPLDPFDGMFMGFGRFDDDVFNALREECMELCPTLYQPLKRVLTEECQAIVGRRVFRSWMGDEDGSVKGELVAGVTSSGFLVGVYFITRRIE